MKKRVAVVIPNYGSRAALGRCLDSLSNCTRINEVEVIVVHSGPEHLNLSFYNSSVKVTIVEPSKRLYAGAARNMGVMKAASCDFILFIDSDCTPGRDWISTHLKALNHGADVVAGPVLPGPPKKPTGLAEYLIEFAVTRRVPLGGEFISVPACNFSIQRKLFDKLGGFPDNPTGQDLLFNLRLRAKGRSITYMKSASVYHFCRNNHMDFISNRKRIGKGLGIVTHQAELEGLLNNGVSFEYRFLRVICRSPFGILLLPSKIFRLVLLIFRGDITILKFSLSCPISLIQGLYIEGKSCRSGYVESMASQ